jgi:DNA-binding response OmpR family regulator
MSGQTVLILSTEPVLGALLGLYAELHGYRVLYADRSQTSDDAVDQSNPRIIVMDLEHSGTPSASFVALQRAAGRSVIVFSSYAEPEEVVTTATRLGVDWFLMPVDAATFRAVLDAAAREGANGHQ